MGTASRSPEPFDAGLPASGPQLQNLVPHPSSPNDQEPSQQVLELLPGWAPPQGRVLEELLLNEIRQLQRCHLQHLNALRNCGVSTSR
jgi:hypothetical protein